MLRPGFGRGLIGFVIGTIIGVALISIIRAVMGLAPASGPAVFFGGFGGLFGWLWGVGTFNPHSHEHGGMEHIHEDEKPGPVQVLIHRMRESAPGIRENVKPLIRPLVVVLGFSAVVLVVIMIISMALGAAANATSKPIVRVQTETPLASAVTPAGDIILGDTLHVNKTVFFLILSAVILGILAGTALIMALLMNALSHNVQEAKASPDNPPKTEPPLFRLIDFFVSWINDILEGTKHSVQR